MSKTNFPVKVDFPVLTDWELKRIEKSWLDHFKETEPIPIPHFILNLNEITPESLEEFKKKFAEWEADKEVNGIELTAEDGTVIFKAKKL